MGKLSGFRHRDVPRKLKRCRQAAKRTLPRPAFAQLAKGAFRHVEQGRAISLAK